MSNVKQKSNLHHEGWISANHFASAQPRQAPLLLMVTTWSLNIPCAALTTPMSLKWSTAGSDSAPTKNTSYALPLTFMHWLTGSHRFCCQSDPKRPPRYLYALAEVEECSKFTKRSRTLNVLFSRTHQNDISFGVSLKIAHTPAILTPQK